jgi:fused signal recognition particle receptor
MFGKIRGKLKSVFSKSEEEIFEEEKLEDENQEELDSSQETTQKELIDEKQEINKEKKENKPKTSAKKKQSKKQEENLKEKTIEEESLDDENEDLEEEPDEISQDETDEKSEKKGFFSKTFGKLTSKKLNEDDFEKIWLELEIFLLEINIAYEIVQKIEESLRESIIGKNFDRFSLAKKIREVLIDEVNKVLQTREADFLDEIKKIRKSDEAVRIIVLGVNGTGKTTTIAKLVKYLEDNNLKSVVAASDTFRAAAIEQLEEHSKKLGFKLIKHKGGSDPAAVSYDAIEHAKAKNLDVVIIDTAGRMPNNSNLMQELSKIERVSKAHMNIFVGDSVSGNDLIEQINLFDKVMGINGIILTKTDTDERPGSIVTAAYSLEKPIYFLGIGQTYDDLIKFDSKLIAQKLFEIEEE